MNGTGMVEKAERSRQEQNWGMLCHLTALTVLLGVPFGHLLGPLVVWLLKKNEYPFVDNQGKESLNFQISMSIYAVLAGILILLAVGLILLFALLVTDVILVIVASVKVSRGEPYRYPLSIRFIK